MVSQPSLFEIASSSGASRHPARGDQILIGRSPENDIVLSNEPTVSRRHAELVHDGEAWAVRDLGSHNGTYVNGVRLTDDQTHPIAAADVVGVGNVTVRLLPGIEVDG